MSRERIRVFKESLAPKKLVKESKLEEVKKTRFLALVVTRDAYAPTEVGGTMTVEELIDALQEFDMSLPVVFSNDGGYTYGAVDNSSLKEFTYKEDEDEDMDESKEKGHAKFKVGHELKKK